MLELSINSSLKHFLTVHMCLELTLLLTHSFGAAKLKVRSDTSFLLAESQHGTWHHKYVCYHLVLCARVHACVHVHAFIYVNVYAR